MKEVTIKILDLQKYDSYTQRGRFVVSINGQRQLSGGSEQEALEKTLKMIFGYMEDYKAQLSELTEKLQPVLNHFIPEED